MFTGIVDHCGTVTEIEEKLRTRRIWIKSSFTDLQLGESISVDGICLTVTEIKQNRFSCDISKETENVTTAKFLHLHQIVNLERALQLSSRLGGHMVSGHVDQTCQVNQCKTHDAFLEIHFVGLVSTAKNYIIKKGSIAVNGVSLTINEIYDDGFSVTLIPHTLEHTNLGRLKQEDYVNIEFDMVAKMIFVQSQNYITDIRKTLP